MNQQDCKKRKKKFGNTVVDYLKFNVIYLFINVILLPIKKYCPKKVFVLFLFFMTFSV